MKLSMAASTSASHDFVVMITNKFHLPSQDVFTNEALVCIKQLLTFIQARVI